MMILCLITILLNSLFYRVLSIYHVLNNMPNFSIKYSYTCNKVVYRKTAIVRASDSEVAKNKIVDFYLRYHRSADSFSFDKITLSNYNLILV